MPVSRRIFGLFKAARTHPWYSPCYKDLAWRAVAAPLFPETVLRMHTVGPPREVRCPLTIEQAGSAGRDK
jgi:hypothetical protein